MSLLLSDNQNTLPVQNSIRIEIPENIGFYFCFLNGSTTIRMKDFE